MMTFSLRPLLLAVLLAASPAAAETITLATYNIENFRMNFEAHRIARELAKRAADPEMLEIIATERQQNDEDNWEIASVILDPRVSPDIIVIQEGCRESDLKYFNNRWLRGAYETVFVFNTNTTRDQNLGIMLKPGFKVIERKDDFHLEPDPIPNPRGETFFARGPGFVLVESPSGYRFWVGNTHQKSKGGNIP